MGKKYPELKGTKYEHNPYVGSHPAAPNTLGLSLAGERWQEGYDFALKEVRAKGLKAIDDEPEFPDEMPDEIWKAIILDKEGVTAAMRVAVKLTKQGIKERFEAVFKEAAK